MASEWLKVWMEGHNINAREGEDPVKLWWGCWVGEWVCLAAICTTGPWLRKQWRSGIKVYVCCFCGHLCICGSVAAGQLCTKYRAGEGVWLQTRLRIGLQALGYREWTMSFGWALRSSTTLESFS